MPEWLVDAVEIGDVAWGAQIVRVLMAIASGFVVAGIYNFASRERRAGVSTLPVTLVLLSVLVSLVTVVIGTNVARAFGLVGALSIVRFRTVVEDTRDTAFVIFAVVVGMTAGAGEFLLTLIGITAVVITIVIVRRLWYRGMVNAGTNAHLTVRVSLGQDPATLLAFVFSSHLKQAHLVGATTARQGSALEFTYNVVLASVDSMYPLMSDLNRIEGVQNVELRETAG